VTTFHMSITKERLLAAIRCLGLHSVLVVPPGVTEADMIARIERDPRECFPLDPSCDRWDADGSCAGHEDPAA